MHVRYILSSVCIRLSQLSQSSFVQDMKLCEYVDGLVQERRNAIANAL